MSPLRRIAGLLALLALAACSSSHRVTYSGHEESTEGIPGFVNGKRVSPNVKLGQSYTVDGETYVPHYQPDYAESGLASWYGPGFHGGKTANGETFDKSEMTAAHRTLPLPSIVRVTLLSTGKSAVVRVNDRGPFAKGRIIDLSRAAAEQIGLIGVGVGKVKVEYLPAESQRFADLLADGRDPKSIDIVSDVIAYTADHAPNAGYEHAQPGTFDVAANAPKPRSTLSRLNPVGTAQAQEMPRPMNDEADTDSIEDTNAVAPAPIGDNPDSVSAQDLPPASLPSPAVKPAPITIVPAAAKPIAAPRPVTPAPVIQPAAAPLPSPASPPAVTGDARFIQLGAFASRTNAEALVGKVRDLGPAGVSESTTPAGQPVYRVRMGPYPTASVLQDTLDRLQVRGIDARAIREP